jgi:hypothetical protein
LPAIFADLPGERRVTFGLQTLVGLLSIVGGAYAAFDLLSTGGRARRPLRSDIAGAFVLVLLLTIGVDLIIFGQNAVLQVGFILQLPLLAVQIAFVAVLLLASFVWTKN